MGRFPETLIDPDSVGFWIPLNGTPVPRYWILDCLIVELGFRIPQAVFGIPKPRNPGIP